MRNNTIDYLKAFAMMLVIIGHCVQCGSGAEYLEKQLFFEDHLFKVIYSFHMSLFMLLSGYLFRASVKRYSFAGLIKNKLKSLLLPIMLWSLVPYVYSVIKPAIISGNINVKALSLTYIDVAYSGFWFLWATLICTVIMAVNSKVFKDNPILPIVIIIASLFVSDANNLNLYKYMFPYFVIGYYWKRREIKHKSLFITCAAIIYVAMLIEYKTDYYVYVTPYKNQYFIDIYRFLIGLAGSVLFILLFSLIGNVRIGKVVRYISSKTRDIYIISTLFFSYVLVRYTENVRGVNYIRVIAQAIITMCVTLIIIFIIDIFKRVLFREKV